MIVWRWRVRRDYQGHLDTFVYIHYLDCDDGFTDVYICQNLKCMLYLCVICCMSIIPQESYQNLCDTSYLNYSTIKY